jgi:DNA primase
VHVQKLMRQTDTVVFSFDGDAAGRRAARRAMDACLPHAADNRTIRFLFLPPEHDPDSYIRERGTDAFLQAVEQALPLSQFLLGEVLNGKELDQPEGRAKALFEAKPLIQALPANALRAQILHRLADRLDVPFEEVAGLCEVDTRTIRAPHSAPARSERRRVTGNEQRALRNLVMHPRIVAVLDDEDQATLAGVARHSELFDEVVAHARALGVNAEFQLLSDLLRNSPNAPTYEEIFREILVYDENVRDLLLHNPEDEALMARYQEQERLAGEELRAAVAKLRYEAYCERLDVLSRQAKFSAEETAEFTELSHKRADLKRRLGLQPE